MKLNGTNNNKNGKKTVCYYSNPSLNPSGEARCMTITDSQTGITSISFEDSSNGTFDDIIFYVESDIQGTLQNNSGETTGGEADHIDSYSGTYAFEDIWSSGGDYDMNDVVVEYQREAAITCHNEIRSITETYKVVHNGATYEDGFGITLPFSPSMVKSVTVNGTTLRATDGSVGSYKGTAPRWEAAASDSITLVLFDDINAFGSLKNNAEATYKVKVEFNAIGTADSTYTTITGYETASYIDSGGHTVTYEVPVYSTAHTSRDQYPTMDASTYSRTAYDPFIIVYNLTASNSNIRREVHLPKKSVTKLGDPAAGENWNLWFVGRFQGQGERQFPFGIDLPVSCNPADNKYFKVSNETVLITESYTKFAGWTDSQGSTGTDWYLNGDDEKTQVVQAYQ